MATVQPANLLYSPSQVLNDKGYDGALADIWSCGVILYVLMAGYLPFDEQDLMTLYKKVRPWRISCGALLLTVEPFWVRYLNVTALGGSHHLCFLSDLGTPFIIQKYSRL